MHTAYRSIAVLAVLATSFAMVLPSLSAPTRERIVIKRQAIRHIARPASEALLMAPMADFGAPLPDLSPSELAAFATGLDEFRVAQTPAAGLGPIMNNRSCVACHAQPAVGGGSGIRVTRFGRTTNGVFDAMGALGGSLLQQNSIDPAIIEVVPATATISVQRQSTSLFGMGLIEAIPDETILYVAEQQKRLGLNGVPSLVADVVSGKTRIGRFGWKAQQASVLAFSGDAFVNEMGITNRLFPLENAPNGNAALLARFDRVADPEDLPDPVSGKADIDVVADFMRFLAPPPQLAFTSSAVQGKAVFDQVGCSGCHTPQMMTGPNPIRALNFKEVNLYSDLLLHDMGALGDGIAEGTAGSRDMKTPPLWGLRASGPYLHDGRAPSIDQAIQAHDGEALISRNLYRQLNPAQRQQLLDFLGSI